MNAQHTPGPWYSDKNGAIWRRNPSDLYENGGGVAGDRQLATAWKGWVNEGKIGYPLDANARLIAAAPDLLEALSSIDVYLSDTLSGRVKPDQATYKQWLIDGIIEARNRARAVIAKATGGAA